MAIVGPLSMISLFIAWLVLLIIGFGLITFWVSDGNGFVPRPRHLGLIGLHARGGLGPPGLDRVPRVHPAGCGLLVIAMEIAYSTLYSAFATRVVPGDPSGHPRRDTAWDPNPDPFAWFHTMGAARALRQLGALGG